MMVTIEPEFEKYCQETYILDNDEEDDIHKVQDEEDCGYFYDDDVPIQEMSEVSDEWFLTHLMDDTDIPTKTPESKSDNDTGPLKSKQDEDVVGDAENIPKTEDILLGDRKPPPESICETGDDAVDHKPRYGMH
jgi:hypothetical protein